MSGTTASSSHAALPAVLVLSESAIWGGPAAALHWEEDGVCDPQQTLMAFATARASCVGQ